MKIQFVAEDGRAFDTREECTQHEKHMRVGRSSEFVNLIRQALQPFVKSPGCKPYLPFESDDGKEDYAYVSDIEKVSVAIASNFPALADAFNAALLYVNTAGSTAEELAERAVSSATKTNSRRMQPR